MKILNSLDDLFTSNGKLNSAVLRRGWFKQSSIYMKIMEDSCFLPEDSSMLLRIHVSHFGLTHLPKCVICDSTTAHFDHSTSFGKFKSTCKNRSCIAKFSANKRIDTMISRYGAKVTENHISKNKNAVSNFIDKSKASIIQKYGVDNPSKIPGISAKKKETLLANHGVTHPAKIKAVKKKAKEQSITFFSSLCDSVNVDDLLDPVVANKIISFACLLCGKADSLPSETYKWRAVNLGTPCTDCSKVRLGSLFQRKIAEFITSIYDGDIILNDRKVLDGLELDILLPDLKIAIEANGVYWHSTQCKEEDNFRKNYHVNKTNVCSEKGIRLIHVFEDDWINKREIIKGRLSSLISPKKIHARKCSLVYPDSNSQRKFLNLNHSQGYIHSSICIGLEYENQLVAIMTLGKPRFNKNHQWELLRLCTLNGYTVVGGASKMLQNFRLSHQFESIICYSDRTWGNGEVYSKLGFESAGVSNPSYRWIKNLTSLSRYQAQKHRLKNIVANFNPEMSESENMFADGWRRIWDCGTTKWILKAQKESY